MRVSGEKQYRVHVYCNILQCDLISSTVELPAKATSLHPYSLIKMNLCTKRNSSSECNSLFLIKNNLVGTK